MTTDLLAAIFVSTFVGLVALSLTLVVDAAPLTPRTRRYLIVALVLTLSWATAAAVGSGQMA